MSLAPKKPIYKQIIDDFKHRISTGELKPNDPIPSQTELALIYKTSEMTMRKALAFLVEEDLIIRIRKKGSFIKAASRMIESDANSLALTKIYFVHHNILSRLLNDGFYLAMLSGIAEVCTKHQIEFAIYNIGDNLQLPDDLDAGYILFGLFDEKRAEFMSIVTQWKLEKRKMLTIQFYFPHLEIPYIAGDNLAGGYLATQHLLDLGHTHIGIIVSGKSQMEIYSDFSFRLQGYRLALSNHNIAFDPDLVIVKDCSEETEVSGYEGFNELMELAEPPSAVFAASDYKAIGAIQAANHRGLKVPSDISIIGYDGQPIGQWTSPRLTTVDQNTFQFGKQAAEMLLYGDTKLGNSEAQVSPHLIIRESTQKFGESK
ncbi:GntR family transcriptional regulator [Paenibacillus psychroresistens]|uniref:GntR family transcriptional regulator n=1 Tax=Paenibacillus psychroresistens TaxID=1778678 RepID=A0A6B8RGQ2_9BACL|nr:GntR family transcriptional regulator [Paenibacillus psychroresistens]QGQ94578.1 GntR family transcriptional regulator [Paenibacillus psychroresistens]